MRLLFGCLMFSLAAYGDTIATNLTVTNATATISGTNLTATGPAMLTNIGNGTFSLTGSLASISGLNASAPFTISLTGGNTITGSLTVPVSLLLGTATTGTGSATITGGTGTYAGATGSFPTITGSASGSVLTTLTVSLAGAGTINTGGPAGPPVPTITLVGDAGDYSANLAPGSIFIVKGSNLSASGFTSLSFPLPASPGGVGIRFTPVGSGAPIDAYLIYLYNQNGVNQLAAILPSSANPGAYNVTVTSGGATSAPTLVNVVASNPRLFTQDSSGNGLAVIQNYVSASQLDVNRFTTDTISGITISPAHAGQTLIAWVTGLGSAPGTSNTASPGYDFTKNGVMVQAIVGGVKIPAAYAGRAPGLAGVDQVNFTLPANVPTGCTVPFQISENGVLTQSTFLSIAPDANSKACVQPGWTTAQLSDFDKGGTYSSGSWSIVQFSENLAGQKGPVKIDTASGAFSTYTGFQLPAITPPGTLTGSTSGACTVTHTHTPVGQQLVSGVGTNLDAGTVTLNGPNGSSITNMKFAQGSDNLYSLNIAQEGLPSVPGFGNGMLVAGTYTVAGAGGTAISPFSVSSTIGTPLNLTAPLPASVTESAGLTITWAPGSNPSDVVQIYGSSTTTTGTGADAVQDGTLFVCRTTAGQMSFTVDSSILQQLPPTTSGFLAVVSSPAPTNFTAALKNGGSIPSNFAISVGYAGQTTYQ